MQAQQAAGAAWEGAPLNADTAGEDPDKVSTGGLSTKPGPRLPNPPLPGTQQILQDLGQEALPHGGLHKLIPSGCPDELIWFKAGEGGGTETGLRAT